MAIDPIGATGLTNAIKPPALSGAAPAGAGAGAAASFTDSLKSLIDSVDSTAAQANDAVNGMVNGSGDVHSAMIALQRAETMLELTVQVRNKLVQAYQDVMRMPI